MNGNPTGIHGYCVTLSMAWSPKNHNTKWGVNLIMIDKEMDTGDIWPRKIYWLNNTKKVTSLWESCNWYQNLFHSGGIGEVYRRQYSHPDKCWKSKYKGIGYPPSKHEYLWLQSRLQNIYKKSTQ